MKVIILADGSPEIGMGHIMRTSVLAEEFIKRNFEVVYITKIEMNDWILNRLRKIGIKYFIPHLKDYNPNPSEDILIIDSYLLPITQFEIRRDRWKKVIAILDEISPNYNADIYIVPSLIARHGMELKANQISGPEYALIRNGIKKRLFSDISKSTPQKILVVGGGTDIQNFSRKVALAIEKLNLSVEVNFITNDRFESKSYNHFVFHPLGSDIDKLAEQTDVAITTASTLSHEFIAREIPLGIICLVRNQLSYYSEIKKLDLAVPLGSFVDLDNWEPDLVNLNELLFNENLQNNLRKKMANLIDLDGAFRVVDLIVEYQRF